MGGAAAGRGPGDSLPCSSLPQSRDILRPGLPGPSSLYDIYFWAPGGADAVCSREGNARRAGRGAGLQYSDCCFGGRPVEEVERLQTIAQTGFFFFLSFFSFFLRRELTFLLDTAAAVFSTPCNFKIGRKETILKWNSSAGADERKDSQSVSIPHKGREVILSQTPVRDAYVSHAALFAAN